MPRYLLQLYTPHEGQIPLHASTARFRVICCGRRFGKTVAAANEVCRFACEHHDTLTWWVAPTYRQARIAYRMIKRALAAVTRRASDTELRIELLNGAVVECRSADNADNLRGEGVHFLVLEEAAMMPEKVWYQVLRPMLADTNGSALFISTPRGRNWFYVLFQRGLDPLYPEYKSFHFPTSKNPYIPASEIEAAKRDLPEDVYRQEFLAEFLEESAGVFRRIDQCISGELDEEPLAQEGHSYTLGWDPAKYRDFSVISVIDVNKRHLCYFERSNRVEYTTQIERVIQVATAYNAYVLIDMTGVGDPLLEQVKKAIPSAEGYLLTNASKKALIENLVLAIQNRAITFPDIAVLLTELRQMEYRLSASRLIQYAAPEGAHDDCVLSLALACYAASAPRVPLDGERDGEDVEIVVPTIAEIAKYDPFEWASEHYSKLAQSMHHYTSEYTHYLFKIVNKVLNMRKMREFRDYVKLGKVFS